jgi:hypothetical protein
MCGTLSDESTSLSFTIDAGPCQRSHSLVLVPPDSWPHFTVSDWRFPQPGWPGSFICIPQEQGGPILPANIGFPFRRLLQLAGLWWRYWNPPPREDTQPTIHITSARTTKKTMFPTFPLFLRVD